jgi:phenylacetate-CoA ligase
MSERVALGRAAVRARLPLRYGPSVTLDSWLRRTGFWALDRLKGGAIRHHYDDIHSIMTGRQPDAAVLSDLLEHAARTTPAYAAYAGAGLHAFPVLGRDDLRNRSEAFRSAAFAPNALHVRRTSGSTGVPLTVVHDPGKRQRAIADVIYFNETAGQRVGDRLVWLFSARLVSHGRIGLLRQNIIPFDHVGLDERRMAEVVATLRKERVNAVLSVPSTLASLARYIEREDAAGGGFGLRAVIAAGETLDGDTKGRIATAFGCPVVDRYANEENGVLASSLPDDDEVHLNVASYVVELLSVDRDEPAAPGTPGRVVVTDLYSRAMPLIRYDTGDLALKPESEPQLTRTLARIEGRAADVIRTPAGGLVSAPMVSALMARRFPDIAQYQLVQVGAASYRLSVVAGDLPPATDRLAGVVREMLLGADAGITVEVVPGIAAGATGKRRVVFSEWTPALSGTP